MQMTKRLDSSTVKQGHPELKMAGSLTHPRGQNSREQCYVTQIVPGILQHPGVTGLAGQSGQLYAEYLPPFLA